MLVLITYDVNTETPAGRKRLRKVAKRCVDHGQRVQNSVFECLLDAAQYAVLKAELTALIDPALDSLRFYQLGNNYKSKVEQYRRSSALRAGRPAVVLSFAPRCEGRVLSIFPAPSHRIFVSFCMIWIVL